jgi:copper chaperone CopZ
VRRELTNVTGMSRAHREAKVEKELGELPGVSAKADSNANRIEVSYDESRVDGSRIAEAVEKAGYTVHD